jgi:hypothetical protein
MSAHEPEEIEGEVLDPEEEAEILAREAEIPELDRLGHLRPLSEYLAESRARRQRLAG